MRLEDYHFDLPQELIAQEPLLERVSSKLLSLRKSDGLVSYGKFTDIIDCINTGDCLVLNDTRVIPARLLGKKDGTDGNIEFVLLKKMNGDIWEVLAKPGRKAKVGARFYFGNRELMAEVIEIVDDGNRLVRFEYDGIFERILDKVGIMPLPPYITTQLSDRERYQTVYSKTKGSAAAPTAGLHFTNKLLEKLKNKGVNIVYLTLHVGLGTFRPVKVENILDHKMHSEFYSISEEACQAINMTKKSGGRIVAVGTTSCRVLETVAQSDGLVKPQTGWTDIFIYPGYSFKMIDSLITNFHLPESTLIMLVSALAGRENVIDAYNEAIKEKYRFFSFGDAMYIY